MTERDEHACDPITRAKRGVLSFGPERFDRVQPPVRAGAAETTAGSEHPVASHSGCDYLLISLPAELSEDPSGLSDRSYWEAPDAYRIWEIGFRVQGPDGHLLSHNLQFKLGAPDLTQVRRADLSVAMYLTSGWWVTLRHEFAAAPRAAEMIVASAADELAAITDRATGARGTDATEIASELASRRFRATGPAAWPPQ
jgi:hypothetical protein